MKHAWLLLIPSLLPAQSGSFSLGTATVVAGATAGSASVELIASAPTAAWTATSNATWLHLPPASTSGSGSALIQFSYDANTTTGIQSGTLTIAGQTLTVTQAGNTFQPAGAVTTLIPQGLSLPYAVALDNAGNLYIADTGHNTIQESIAATQRPATLGVSGLNSPHGVAVDGQGNVYIADSYNNAIKQWVPATQQMNTLVSAGLTFPVGVAVDTQGNVYIADFGDNAIKEWSPSPQQLTTLVGSGLNNPTGVAVDALGNVYIADFRNNAIKQWSPATGSVTTLVGQGLSFPNAVTVDGQGNVYFVDGNNNAIKEWSPATQTVNTLVSTGVNGSFGLVTDGQGSFYIANTNTSTVLKFSTGYMALGATSMNEGPQAGTDSVTLQLLGAGLPLTATCDQPWLTITGTSAQSIGFAFQANTSVYGRTAHITMLGQQVTVTQSGDVSASLTKSAGDGQSTPAGQAFPVLLQVTVTDGGGMPVQGAAVNFSVTPGTNGAGGTFSTTPPMPIPTDQNGNAIAPVLTANAIAGQFSVTAGVNGLSATFSLTNIGYALASSSAVVGSAAGNGTALLITTGPWTAASNASWLQIAPGSTSGVGSALVQFSYGANTNSGAQTGTLTIGGLTFTVMQAAAGSVQVTPVTTLVSSGLNYPQGVAVDGSGNIYIADTANNAIKEWIPGTQQIVQIASGLNAPKGVAVDGYGNVYAADSGNNAIEEFAAPNRQLTTLVSGLNNPSGVAVDGLGNVYFSDTGNSAIKEWNAITQAVTTLAGTGLNNPTGVAVDGAGNVYFADSGNNTIKEWMAATGQVTALASAGLNNPTGVAVDGQANVYLADTGNNAVKQWNAGNQQVSTLVATGLNNPMGMAADAHGNLYAADTNNNAIKQLTPAWLSLSVTTVNEPYQAGTGTVTAQVLPSSVPLTATSDQPWLTITGIAGGVISFSFTSNTTGANRTAHITVLGPQVTVMQSGDLPANLTICAGNNQSTAVGQPFGTALQVCVTDAGGNAMAGVLVAFSVTPGTGGASGTFSSNPPMPVPTNQSGSATAPVLTANGTAGTFTVTASVGALTVTFTLTNLVYTLGDSAVNVGSAAGSGTVLLFAAGPWTATSNASWLQLSAGSGSGTGDALIQFTYAANLNAGIQTGTLTISGLTFTVTQAGTSFTPVDVTTTLVSSGLKSPEGVAVDAAGNVYIADTNDNAIKEWSVSTQLVSALVSSGLNAPTSVAVDSQYNVYFADSKNNAIKEWNATTKAVTSLVSSGLSSPFGVAVDSQGNVYFSDTGHNDIKEWSPVTKAVTTLVSSGLNSPRGVAVDAQDNVYFADSGNNTIKEYNPITKAVTSLVSSGLKSPYGVAVDGYGNVFIADTSNSAIKEWSPVTKSVTTLIGTGLKTPYAVAVDSQDKVYFADSGDGAIGEYTAANFSVGYTSRSEVATAGTDSVSVQILPAGTALTATSNQTWLKITSTKGGSIAFSFTANTSALSRTGQITVLGLQVVNITQSGDTPYSITKTAGSGESTTINQVFPTALQVRVKDAAGNYVQNASVTFTAVPSAKGCNGTFSSSAPVLTNSSGLATASTLTANGIAGTFTVTASVGTLSTTFNLTVNQ